MKRAIFFATYPIDVPRHGGQIRSAALSFILRREGWIVHHLSVFHPHGYDVPNLSDWHFPLMESDLTRLTNEGAREDVDASSFILRDKVRFDRVRQLISQSSPDILVIEQAWLWPLVKQVISENMQNIPIVYSSHNSESEMLASLATKRLSCESKDRHISAAVEIERDLLAHCTGLICVSSRDQASFGFRGSTLVAPNGVWRRDKPGGLTYWQNRLKHLSYLLYVGSAHPPNAEGFCELMGASLTYLNPTQKILVVGGVCALLQNEEFFTQNGGINEARVELVGMQDEGGLTTLIELSTGFILPIKQGGGTNLKTAEALYSRKPVVGTTVAFRGFERFIGFPNVTIADDVATMKKAVQAVLSADFSPRSLSEGQKLELDELTWPQCLRLVPDFLGSLLLSQRLVNPRPLSGVLEGEDIARLAVTGWHGFEDLHSLIWSKEKTAVLFFPPDSLSGGDVLSVKVATFSNQANVIAIGTRSRELVRSPSNQMIDCVFSTSLVSSDFFNDGSLELYLEVECLYSPADFGLSDKRLLGLALKELIIGSSFNGS